MRGQALISNGYQTAGNIFREDHPLIRRIESIIRSKIEAYRNIFAGSAEPFLTRWPESYALEGWLVAMHREGFLRSHIHESGWISGTLYVNVPKELEKDQGCISFSTHGGVYPGDQKDFPEKIVGVERGMINLFPSSLFHHTIPFESKEERISLAFDVVPS